MYFFLFKAFDYINRSHKFLTCIELSAIISTMTVPPPLLPPSASGGKRDCIWSRRGYGVEAGNERFNIALWDKNCAPSPNKPFSIFPSFSRPDSNMLFLSLSLSLFLFTHTLPLSNGFLIKRGGTLCPPSPL